MAAFVILLKRINWSYNKLNDPQKPPDPSYFGDKTKDWPLVSATTK